MVQSDKRCKRSRSFWISLFIIGLILLLWPVPGKTADQENCQLCHRYSGLAAFTPETGTKKIFYVNENIYRNTVHGSVQCTHCHKDVKEVPHKPTKKVDCGEKCHVKEPSTEKDFSHKPIVEKFKKSSHGQSKLFQYQDGQPKCKYCHQNPRYQPLRGILAKHSEDEQEALSRCMGCHEKDEWTKRFLQHFVSRTSPRWSNREIVDLCNTCHANEEMMSNFMLDTTANFKETFHWRNVKYDMENGAHCLSCHAPKALDYDSHDILKSSDPNSPTFLSRRIKTCGQSGCHTAPTSSFVKGSLHGTGLKVALLNTKLEEMEGKLSEKEEEDLTAELKHEKTERLKRRIIWAIKLFYKIMILLVPGTMFIHQMLDLRITLKERKERRH
ncbi:MAG: hypothetical protein ACMUIU_05765 [bacterium]